MGLLDGLVGEVLGSLQGAGTQGQVGQQHADVATNLLQMLTSGQGGGLSGLVNSFQQAGIGDLIQGWISTGPNPPATASQIQQGLGQGNLQNLSRQTGLSISALLPIIVQILPTLIDKMTPDGQIPRQASGSQGGDLGSLIGGLLGGKR